MGLFDNLFMHYYDIRCHIELADGRKGKAKLAIEARFVTEEDLVKAVIKEIEWKLGSKVVKVTNMYDASAI